MTVLSNNMVNPDDVAAHWLDRVEEMVNERVDYDGNPIEPDYECGGGSITIGNRQVRIVGVWSEVVFQWFDVGGAWSEGDYRLPLTFDVDEEVDDIGTTVEELLDEAVEYLEGWRADIVWDSLSDELWVNLDNPRAVEVKGEGLCYRDANGTTWGWSVDPERGNADIAAVLHDRETGKVDWTEYGFVNGLDVLLIGMAKAVEEAVAEVRERLVK